jgi:hypothetical protein
LRSLCGAHGRLSTSSLQPMLQNAESKQPEPPDRTTLCACLLACVTRSSPASPKSGIRVPTNINYELKAAIFEVTQLRGSMQFLAEQHLVAAKLVREGGARRTGAERESFIAKSNSFVACVRLMAKDRGGICLDDFDWTSLTPDWGKIDEQMRRLALQDIASPPLVPDL